MKTKQQEELCEWCSCPKHGKCNPATRRAKIVIDKWMEHAKLALTGTDYHSLNIFIRKELENYGQQVRAGIFKIPNQG